MHRRGRGVQQERILARHNFAALHLFHLGQRLSLVGQTLNFTRLCSETITPTPYFEPRKAVCSGSSAGNALELAASPVERLEEELLLLFQNRFDLPGTTLKTNVVKFVTKTIRARSELYQSQLCR